jgi:hypothetical protein
LTSQFLNLQVGLAKAKTKAIGGVLRQGTAVSAPAATCGGSDVVKMKLE